MVGKTIDIDTIINPDSIAVEIADKWRLWTQQRQPKMEEWNELRNYLFATDTKTTSNNSLPWKNSTTVPKLTQIRDNLHANYMAAMFPQKRWMRWEASDKDSMSKKKREAIQFYMENKLRLSNFETTMSKLVLDFIDYGNCFATVEYERNFTFLEDTKEYVKGYVGPKLVRISPFDIVFNPTASDFASAPKIIRSIQTLGDIQRMVEDNADNEYLSAIVDKMMGNRQAVAGFSDSEIYKNDGYIADGFGSIKQYYESDFVELLTFYGDFYDKTNKKLHKNRIITVVDRSYVIRDVPNPSWLGKSPIFHVGWRERPDNLYAMGPLDNLVGMQYRIDHLENLKADVFDQIAFPILKIKGDVEDFDFQPGSRIYLGDEGDVGYLAPDATALNADMQIMNIMNAMEEMAGAPKQAMGIRTPGEKTAFEVNALQNASGRIFQNKTQYFEKVFTEPVLNAYLEAGRRNMDSVENVKAFDEDLGIDYFMEVTKEDIVANGKLVPVGARHFAERAQRLQNLQQLWMAKANDPSVATHLSGKEFARIMSEELSEPDLFGVNIAVMEQMETQRTVQEAQIQMQSEQQANAELGV
jgi:hypothetical protein